VGGKSRWGGWGGGGVRVVWEEMLRTKIQERGKICGKKKKTKEKKKNRRKN